MFDNFHNNFAKSNQQKDSRWKGNTESTTKFQARDSESLKHSEQLLSIKSKNYHEECERDNTAIIAMGIYVSLNPQFRKK